MIDLIFDTETTGLVNFNESYEHPSQPHLVELGMQLYNDRRLLASLSVLIRSTKSMSDAAVKVNGLTNDLLNSYGIPLNMAMGLFAFYMTKADRLVAHNYRFDQMVMLTQFHLLRSPEMIEYLNNKPYLCTMEAATPILKLPGKYGEYKWPTLDVAYRSLVDPQGFSGAHRAIVDVEACTKVLWAIEDRQK